MKKGILAIGASHKVRSKLTITDTRYSRTVQPHLQQRLPDLHRVLPRRLRYTLSLPRPPGRQARLLPR